MNKGNIMLVVAAFLALLLVSLVGAAIFNKQHERSGMFLHSRMQKIKNIKKIPLMNCCFQQKINIYNTGDDTIKQIEAVALIPVQAVAYIDFGAASFTTSDSVLQKITLPQPEFDTIKMIDENELLKNKKQYLIMGNADDAKLWQSVQEQTKNMNTSDICRTACKSFVPRADSVAAEYVRSILTLMNYKRHDFTIVFADSAKR